MIDTIWENRTVEDYETTSSTVKTEFHAKVASQPFRQADLSG